MMEYKGYAAHISFDDEAELFHGEIIDIRDVVTFQGKSVKELNEAFKGSIDDYLAFCKERGESPNKPFSGKFLVRLTPEQHRKISIAAKMSEKSLNSWVAEKLESAASKQL